LGLLGRTHKQRFVERQHDDRFARKELNLAISWYAKAYPLNPAWHGANWVALVRRAERDRIELDSPVTSESIARKLIADLGQPHDGWPPWSLAGVGEAYLALNDWDNARRCYGRFAQAPGVDGFAIAGAVRQLREIWRLEPDDSEPGAILAALETRTFATRRGGSLGSSPQHLSKLSRALSRAQTEPTETMQAILGNAPEVPIRDLLSLLDLARVVGQVVNRHQHERQRPSGGTGFLIDGGDLKSELKGRPLLLTNNHLLSRGGPHEVETSMAPGDADVYFQFWEGKPQAKKFTIEDILCSSPPHQCDFTVATLREEESIKVQLPSLDSRPSALGSRGRSPSARVYLVGHPAGRGLEFSLSDTEVLDHELDGEPRNGPRRIHYKAPTEAGMSGSPVVDAESIKVVGLHRSSTRRSLPPGLREGYRANEAVWVASVQETCRRALGGD
jgi:hypothetical protein